MTLNISMVMWHFMQIYLLALTGAYKTKYQSLFCYFISRFSMVWIVLHHFWYSKAGRQMRMLDAWWEVLDDKRVIVIVLIHLRKHMTKVLILSLTLFPSLIFLFLILFNIHVHLIIHTLFMCSHLNFLVS